MNSSLDTLVAHTAARADTDKKPFTPGQIAALREVYETGRYGEVYRTVQSLSASISDGRGVFYSGRMATDDSSAEVSDKYVKNNAGSYRIEDTEVGKYLADPTTWSGAQDELNQVLESRGESPITSNFYLGEPAWRKASEMFAQQAKGPVAIIAHSPHSQAALVKQELPTLMENPEVPALNGIGKEDLRRSQNVVGEVCAACDRAIAEGKTAELGQWNGPEQGRAAAVPGIDASAMSNGTAGNGEPSRAELDAQLRAIAQGKARNPDGAITPLGEVDRREVSGRVLGYTAGKEVALFQRTGGGLLQVDMRGKAELPVGREVELDVKSGGFSGRGFSR